MNNRDRSIKAKHRPDEEAWRRFALKGAPPPWIPPPAKKKNAK